MTALALTVGDPAERQEIGRVEQRHAVVERQPFARVDLFGDASKARLRLGDSLTANSHHLSADGARSRTVQLTAQHPLPPPDHQLAATDLHRHRVTEQHRAEVRVGILPIAVGMIGIVVLVVLRARDHIFEKRQDVGLEGLLATR